MKDHFKFGNTSSKRHLNCHTTRRTPDKVKLPLSQFTKKTWTKVQPKNREIVEYVMSNTKTHGLTSVRKLKQREFCGYEDKIGLGNLAITKPSHLHALVEARKADGWIFGSQKPTVRIDKISTEDIWDSLYNVFTKQKNITFD